jgi:hypothetical protein
MAKRINYGDSIYLIHEMIRSVHCGLALEIEPRVFNEKLIDDLFFIDRVLEMIFESLKKNPMLIIRDEHLRQTLRAKQDFLDILDTILSVDYRGALDFSQVTDRLQHCRDEHRSSVDEIRRLAEENSTEQNPEDQISTTELEFLLNDNDG